MEGIQKTPFKYTSWPFRAMQARSLEETETWWLNCYLENAVGTTLSTQPHWRILTGKVGSGKSVMVAVIERKEADTSFVIRYHPERWPHSKRAWVQNGNHLAQIMVAASVSIRDYLSTHSNELVNLSSLQREFLRWLLEKQGGARAYFRWVDGLEQPQAEELKKVSQEDLYPTCIDPLDIQGQIDELANLIRSLGFERVLITVDLNSNDSPSYLGDLQTLFEWLELTHHPGLALVAAIPSQILEQGEIIRRARGRVSVVHLNWTLAEAHEIATKHIRQATGNSNVSLKDLVTQDLLDRFEQLISEEFGHHAPLGWVALAEALLFSSHQKDILSNRNEPFNIKQLDTIIYNFFARHMLLSIDEQNHGIWRGPRFIRLDEQPMRLLALLRRRDGRPANSDDEELFALAGSKANIHSIVSRVRSAIEPPCESSVYLINKRGAGGYWLENYL